MTVPGAPRVTGEALTFGGEPATTAPGTVTLVEGSSFCLSSPVGDVVPGEAHGLFAHDVRLLSTWQVRVDGTPLHPLAVLDDAPSRVMHLARSPGLDGVGDPGVVVERMRTVGGGMREHVRLRNDGPRHRRLTLEVLVDADLADVFEVKEARVRRRPPRAVERTPVGTRIGNGTRVVEVRAPGAELVCEARRGLLVSTETAPARLRWVVDLPPRAHWDVQLEIAAVVAGTSIRPARAHESVARQRTWASSTPVLLGGDDALQAALEAAREDLGALRITDPEVPDEPAVAAGAPWFMALFGRDSLITSYMALLIDPRLASGTLRVLARHQGVETDVRTEEQPGRVLHELRFGDDGGFGRAAAYYGSVDATPLFVVVLGELRRWGLGDAALHALLPAADRALAWCEEHGDSDGDGFIEYLRSSPDGLQHQGWRDSTDAIAFADGRPAFAPLALAEVQGYWYAALRARASVARSLGDDGRTWDARADRLRDRFDEAFWVPERGCYAIALDGDKRQVDAVTSAVGHCLWSGIVPEARAPDIARRLLSPELFSGWGVRTLATDMAAYDPLGYHSGGVWPHDSALAVAGLMRYGFTDAAVTLGTALVDAAGALGGRLPELLCGFERAAYRVPVAYPAACSPQAWASASPVLVLQTLLRLDVDVSEGALWFSPAVPSQWLPLSLSQVPVAGRRLRLDVDAAGQGSVHGLPDDVRVVRHPRSGGRGQRS